MERHSGRRLRLLTVGDGDLSLSLAIVRCYGVEHVDVTASSVLPTREALLATYPRTAPAAMNELEHNNVTVLYNVDACLLHQYPFAINDKGDADPVETIRTTTTWKPFDMILFQHPHLGDYHADEMDLLQRHCSLLAHYLDSAQSVADYVHVTLCINQAKSWCLIPSATRAGWNLSVQVAVQNPFHQIFPPLMDWFPWSSDPHWQSAFTTTSKIRRQVVSRSKGGSRNWMGRFGYAHVRTTHTKSTLAAAPMLAGSVHYVFARDLTTGTVNQEVASPLGRPDRYLIHGSRTHICRICDACFPTEDELQVHLQSPAMPFMEQCSNALNGVQSQQMFTGDQDRGQKRTKNDQTGSIERLVVTGNSDNDNVDVCNTTNVWGDKPFIDQNGDKYFIVSPEHVGKRLRWYLHHVVGACETVNRSKREWDRLLKQSQICVNGDIVTDSSRILQHAGWRVSVTSATKVGDIVNETEPPITLVAQWSRSDIGDVIVVWKPVGMRAIGSFDSATLEETFSRQQEARTGVAVKYKCLSKLDKGCSGLCLLQPSTSSLDGHDVIISHTFNVLIHGIAEEEWKLGTFIQLPMDGVRRWKKPAQAKEKTISDFVHTDFDAHVVCLEQTTADTYPTAHVPALSTISITTRSKSSRLTPAIAFYLRKTSNRPIVGDRIACQEYLNLPRSMRNRIKQRFCIGCLQVTVENRTTKERNVETFPNPQKWSAHYWQQFCINSATPPMSSKPGYELVQPTGD